MCIFTNFISFFELSFVLNSADGGYSVWSDWSECSKSCGWGSQLRDRECNSPEPSRGGHDCTVLGDSNEVQPCMMVECPGINIRTLSISLPIHSCIDQPSCPSVCAFSRSFVRLFVRSFSYPSIPTIHPSVHSFVLLALTLTL